MELELVVTAILYLQNATAGLPMEEIARVVHEVPVDTIRAEPLESHFECQREYIDWMDDMVQHYGTWLRDFWMAELQVGKDDLELELYVRCRPAL